MTTENKRYLHRLIERKRALEEAYDSIIAEPTKISVVGSVSYDNRSLPELRKEIDEVSRQMMAVVNGNAFGITRAYPKYDREGF